MATSCTILVHKGDMRAAEKTVRQSVTLPAKVAGQVRSMAKSRRLSANRMRLELIENGSNPRSGSKSSFSNWRNDSGARMIRKLAKRLGDDLGRLVFGG